jgi:2-dehydro-3-deoxy-D-arabinonate dehydratase
MTAALWRVEVGGRARLARGSVEGGPEALLPADMTLTRLLNGTATSFAAVVHAADGEPPSGLRLLAPVDEQEVWAAGVTYERSREARREESKVPDLYERVYDAQRPEVFFKCAGRRARGPGQAIGVRADSTWDVPEPELALVVSASGEIVAYTIGNDVSSRSIAGENALYLPQAKYYVGSCAIGPCLVPVGDAPLFRDLVIGLRVVRSGNCIFDDTVPVARMKRTPEELVEWLFRAQEFPEGVVLLTGTGLVPAGDFTLTPGDEVSIAIAGLGELRNTVQRVGRA